MGAVDDSVIDAEDHKFEFLRRPTKKDQLNKPASSKKRQGLDTTVKFLHRERKRKPDSSSSSSSRRHKKVDGGDDDEGVEDAGAARRRGDDTFENRGFAEWLSSPDGYGLMKLFLITNSLLLVVTFAWPRLDRLYRDWRRSIDPEYIY